MSEFTESFKDEKDLKIDELININDELLLAIDRQERLILDLNRQLDFIKSNAA